MKKTALIIVLLTVAASVFSLPAWNPWNRTYAVQIGEQNFTIRFDSSGWCTDLDTNITYEYDWRTLGAPDVLSIKGLLVDSEWSYFEVAFDKSDYYCEGVETSTGAKFTASAKY